MRLDIIRSRKKHEQHLKHLEKHIHDLGHAMSYKMSKRDVLQTLTQLQLIDGPESDGERERYRRASMGSVMKHMLRSDEEENVLDEEENDDLAEDRQAAREEQETASEGGKSAQEEVKEGTEGEEEVHPSVSSSVRRKQRSRLRPKHSRRHTVQITSRRRKGARRIASDRRSTQYSSALDGSDIDDPRASP